MTLLRTRATRRDSGFTLVELLVTMVILGILASIAIPGLIRQRRRGYLATMKADLRNAATSNEAYAVENAGSYVPAAAPGVDALRLEGFRASPGITLVVVDDAMTASGGGFCLEATHANLGAGDPLYFASSGPAAGVPTDTPCTAS